MISLTLYPQGLIHNARSNNTNSIFTYTRICSSRPKTEKQTYPKGLTFSLTNASYIVGSNFSCLVPLTVFNPIITWLMLLPYPPVTLSVSSGDSSVTYSGSETNIILTLECKFVASYLNKINTDKK